MRRTSYWLFLLGTVVLGWGAAARAQTEAPDAGKQAWQAAERALLRGPQKVALRDQATIELPDSYGFVPAKEGADLMKLMGNRTDSRFLGLILPLSNARWFITVDYEAAGYIKDDDAKHWDADGLLKSLKEGTEAANQDRERAGIEPIEVTRWVEPPMYDVTTQRLVWSAEARNKSHNDADPTINYNTYVLGREGYVSMDLITTSSQVAHDRQAAKELLTVVNFNQGKRYSDFNSSTDKVAAYGLAALVGGLAAKKLGLLALALGFFAKFAKLILLGLAAAGGVFGKLFKRNKAQ